MSVQLPACRELVTILQEDPELWDLVEDSAWTLSFCITARLPERKMSGLILADLIRERDFVQLKAIFLQLKNDLASQEDATDRFRVTLLLLNLPEEGINGTNTWDRW